LDCLDGTRRYRTRNSVRRLAYRAHDGITNYTIAAHRRLCRRSGRRDHAIWRRPFRHSGIDYPHDHRRNRRRWLDPPSSVCAMECSGPYCLGLGAYDTRFLPDSDVFLASNRLAQEDSIALLHRRDIIIDYLKLNE
jgi:hypothetical protein